MKARAGCWVVGTINIRSGQAQQPAGGVHTAMLGQSMLLDGFETTLSHCARFAGVPHRDAHAVAQKVFELAGRKL